MIDYKTFKKSYLNEWVDQSQAARKAAEELAMKEVKPSLRDKYAYKDINQNLVFTLDGHKVEFKGENEKNPKDPEYNFFTYDEAIKCFGEPDLKDGWRLPTLKELRALKNDYPYGFDKISEQGVIDGRLYLPAASFCDCSGNVGDVGESGNYWSSTPTESNNAWSLYFYQGGAVTDYDSRCYGLSVRLVRDVK